MKQYDDDETILTEAEIADARSKTVEQVIEEGLCDVIEIGLDMGLTHETIDDVVQRVLTQRRRDRFKVLK